MTNEGVLDNSGEIAAVDRSGMSKSMISLPFQLEKGWELSMKADMKGLVRPSSYVISGMGGSAIGGDIFADVLRQAEGFGVTVNRTYDLPGSIGPGSLHIAVSYSGDTEETLSSFERGLSKGIASIGIASGGRLESICRKESIPFIKIPSGEQPRAALGYMLSCLLGLTTRLGIHDFSGVIMDAVQAARTTIASVSPDVPTKDNMSKALAAWLGDSTPVIISTPEIYSAAERMKTQFNENSKRFAWTMTMPESNHNDWIPIELDPSAGGYKAIVLETLSKEPLLRRRMKVVEDILSKRMQLRKIQAGGGNMLSELLRYIVIGDMTSYYVAILHSVDPTPVEPITALKKALAVAAP